MKFSDLLVALGMAVLAAVLLPLMGRGGKGIVERIPLAVLWLASLLLPREIRLDLYQGEWRPELMAILRRDARMFDNFRSGLGFAVGLIGYSFHVSFATFRLELRANLARRKARRQGRPYVVVKLSEKVFLMSDDTVMFIGPPIELEGRAVAPGFGVVSVAKEEMAKAMTRYAEWEASRPLQRRYSLRRKR